MATAMCAKCGAEGLSAEPPRTRCPKCGSTARNIAVGIAEAAEARDSVSAVGTVDERRNNALLDRLPHLMLQVAVTFGEKTSQGHVIEAVSIPWLAFLEHLKQNPSSSHEIGWRKWEEIIAGAYKDAGFSVVLTNRSGDRGRDIIATKNGVLSVRYFDQVKAYAPGNPVTLDQVHSMLGVLGSAHNVSKGIITTTSDFAPGVYSDPEVQQFVPYRLDLRPRKGLIDWLSQLAQRRARK